MTIPFDAIVLAGGAGTRLGGVDKASLDVGGSTMLERVIAAVEDAERIVCVGPHRHTSVPVTWTREVPPGGGPVPALAAGLRHVTTSRVVVLAVDLPLITADLVRSLVRGRHEAVMASDEDGVPQPLVAAYDTDVLLSRITTMETLHGARLTDAVSGMSHMVVDARDVATDCDTWDDVDSARRKVSSV